MTVTQWFGNFVLVHDDNRYTLTPHNAVVELGLNDAPFNANIKWFNNNTFGNTIVPDKLLCGDTVEVYIGTTNVIEGMSLIFKGEVTKTGELFEGGFNEKSERYIDAAGYGRVLNNVFRGKKTTADYIYNIATSLCVELKNNGYIKDYDIPSSLSNVTISAIDKNTSYWDIFNSMCSNANWDFYVDNGNTIHIFPKGDSTYSTNITPDFDAEYYWDTENMINSITVLGASSSTLGSDDEYTESIDNWTGNNVELSDNLYVAGFYAVKSTTTDTISPALTITFGTPVNLILGGAVHIKTYYYCKPLNVDSSLDLNMDIDSMTQMFPTRATSLEVKMITNVSNFFLSTIEISGGKIYGDWGYANGWNELNIGFNEQDSNGWEEVGLPDWSNISKVGFKIIGPLTDTENRFIIDDMYFSNMAISYSTMDATSVANYGLYSVAPPQDSNNEDTLVCKEYAERLIETYNEPRLIATGVNIDPEKLIPLPLGYRATITLYDNKLPAEIRKITYRMDGKKIKGELELGSCYVPSFERVFKIMKNLMDKVSYDVEAFKRVFDTNVTGIIDTGSDPIMFERISQRFNLDFEANLNKTNLFTSSESGWSMPYKDISMWNTIGSNYCTNTISNKLTGVANVFGVMQYDSNNWEVNTFSILKTSARLNKITSDAIIESSGSSVGFAGFGIGQFNINNASPFIGFIMDTVSPSSDTKFKVSGVYNSYDDTIAETIELGSFDYGSWNSYKMYFYMETINSAVRARTVFQVNNSYIGEISDKDTISQTFVPMFTAWGACSFSPSVGGTLFIDFKGGVIASQWG
jgi:hypothetical protein